MMVELEDRFILNNDSGGRNQKRRRLDDGEEDASSSDLEPAAAAEGSAYRPVEIGDDDVETDSGNGGSNENSWSHEVAVEALSPGDQVCEMRSVYPSRLVKQQTEGSGHSLIPKISDITKC